MKKALLALAVVAMGASAFAQGQIDFINRNINTRADPTVLYNVPIYVQGGRATGVGAGNLAGGVTVGLFLASDPDGATPFFSTLLRTGTDVQAQVFAPHPSGSATATVPGNGPGSTPLLEVRAWQGTSFAAALAGGGQYGRWSFTPNPLGGSPPPPGLPIPTPSMTGWGPESGAGFELVPEPSTLALGALGLGALLLRRRRK